MVENINFLLPYLGLLSHVVLVALFLTFVFRYSWGAGLPILIGKHSTALACLVSLTAVIGSLFYSEIVGFEPCVLCWWQRVFLYPLVIIFGVAAIWKKPASAFLYAVPFASAAALFAAYQSYVYLGGA